MYREKLTVMPSEVSCTNEIKMRALLNRFQDIAGLAVADREGSPSELMRRGYAWVLLRYALKVERRLPGMGESIVVETRHTANDGFYTLRVFRVFSEGNEAETLALAKTSWVLIDLAAGRPVRALQRLPEIFYDVADDPPIDPDFLQIPKLSGPKLKDAPFVKEAAYPVRFHDLDANGHVNNAVYFEWAYETAPLDLFGWGIQEMHAEFRVSAKFGETVLVRVKEAKEAKEAKEETRETGSGVSAPPKELRAFVYDMLDAREKNDKHPLARFYSLWAPLGNHS